MDTNRISNTLLAYEITGLLFYFNYIDILLEMSQDYSPLIMALSIMAVSLFIGFIFNKLITLIFDFYFKITKHYEKMQYDVATGISLNLVKQIFHTKTNQQTFKKVEKEMHKEYYTKFHFEADLAKGLLLVYCLSFFDTITSFTGWTDLFIMILYLFFAFISAFFFNLFDLKIKKDTLNLFIKKHVQFKDKEANNE